MLHLLKQKSLFRRSLCIALIISLCCIPLFGFSRADSVTPPLGDGVIADDMLAEAAGVNLDESDTPKPPFGFPSYEYYVNYTHSFYAGLELQEAGIVGRGGTLPCHPAYGGGYFDNNGLLVINIVDDDAQLKEEITRILKDYSGYYYFRSVTYSYNYLNEIQNTIVAYMMAQGSGGSGGLPGPLKNNFTGCTANGKYNVVRVELLDLSEEAIAYFRENVIDSPALSFEQSPGFAVLY